MSGLKINYKKSEVIVLGASEIEMAQIAGWLNCKEGGLPLKYLGILVSDKMLFAAHLMDVGGQGGKEVAFLAGPIVIFGGGGGESF
jgi:hypothetical protein